MTRIVTEVHFPVNENGLGLPSIDLLGLGEVIALVGPNGAGKSRLLEVLKDHLLDAPSPRIKLEEGLTRAPAVAYIAPSLGESRHTTDDVSKIVGLLNFSRLVDCSLSVIAELAISAALASSPAVEEDGTSEHMRSLWARFNASAKKLLGQSVTVDLHGKAKLFGHSLEAGNLSQGQFRLLQLALVLSIESPKGTPLVVLWDEPELHLHSGIVLQVLDEFRKTFDCQIWLSTHSLSLAAYAQLENIWYIDHRGVARGSKRVQELAQGLNGNTADVDQLRSLLDAPHQQAETAFALQCLLEPTTVGYRQRDPQVGEAISTPITITSPKSSPVRILDWGAGQGRVLAGAIEEWRDTVSTFVDYYAYDKHPKDRHICEQLITTVWGAGHERWFDSFSSLKAAVGERRFDRVLMLNLLHEVEPTMWSSLFREASQVVREDGYVLIMEDLKLPTGEMPYTSGFLILDPAAVKILFGNDQNIQVKLSREDRLASYYIPKRALESVSQVSLRKTIEHCRDHHMENIRELRQKQGKNYADGIDHMRSMMQLSTAQICLAELTPVN